MGLHETMKRQLREGILPCASAFAAAEREHVTPRAMGEEASRLDLRIGQCQLGLFGYAAFGVKALVHPLKAVPEELAEALRSAASAGLLPCREAWRIAEAFGLPRLVVGCAAETLTLRIGHCQLGCF